MKLRKENILLNVLLGSGLYLLDSLRDRLNDSVGDISDQARNRAQDFFETAQERASRASDVIRGKDHRGIGTAAAVLIGVGIGVGVGMLLAPSSGEEIRENLAGKVRDRFSREKEPSTGTYGV
jgi:ElaB/YqjD/DUF883 family membrane-anchored ribosome-binding protein